MNQTQRERLYKDVEKLLNDTICSNLVDKSIKDEKSLAR